MAGGYKMKPQGVDAIAAKFRDLDRKVDAMTKILGSLGLHVNGTTGGLDNDGLNAPVAAAAASDNAVNFALSTTALSTPCSVSIPRPAGFSTALVIATSDLTVISNVTSGASVRTTIQSTFFSPFGQETDLAANVQNFVSNTFAQVLTGLSSAVTVDMQVAADGANIPANIGTWANLNAIAIFLR